MTETKKMVEFTKATYDRLSSIKGKIELIINQNRPRHKIPVSFDQTVQLLMVAKGVNEQLEIIIIDAGL